jgi:hypothetical protein
LWYARPKYSGRNGGLRDGQIWDYPHAKVPQRRNIGDPETQPT